MSCSFQCYLRVHDGEPFCLYHVYQPCHSSFDFTLHVLVMSSYISGHFFLKADANKLVLG